MVLGLESGSTFLDELEAFPRSLHVAGRMQLNPINTSEFLMDRLDVAYPPTFWYGLGGSPQIGGQRLGAARFVCPRGLDDVPDFDGFLHLDFSNTFPVEVTGTVAFDRLDGVLYRDTLVLPAGGVPQGLTGEGTLSIPVNAEMLMPGGDVEVELRVNTFGPQPFTGHEFVRLQGRLEGTQLIEVEYEGAPAHPLLGGVFGRLAASAQDLVADLTPPAERGGASFEVWANQRTNAFNSGFLPSAQQGGFLTREFLQDMLDAHPLLGGMGGQVGWSKRFSTRPLGDGPWALTGAFGSEVLVSALWRRELLELGLIGNANHTGRVDVFNGTGMRVGAFNRVSLGIEHKDTRQRIELSLVQRLAGVEWGIPNGSFWVSRELTPWRSTCRHTAWPAWMPFPTPTDLRSINSCLPTGWASAAPCL